VIEPGYRDASFWLDSLPEPVLPRAPLDGDADADVAIVGAGFSGLWTAYYLKKLRPALRVAVLEAEVAGYGASGPERRLVRRPARGRRGAAPRPERRDQALALQRVTTDAVDEIGRVAAAEGIDCHYRKGGAVRVAVNGAQLHALHEFWDPLAPIFARALEGILPELVPALRDARITHHWGGALGVPRDSRPRVGIDRERGFAWIGGYVGEGVAASNLAGRTLAERLAGERTERTELSLVAPFARNWEPEPLRWLAVRGVLAAVAAADRATGPGRVARWRSWLMRAIAGRGLGARPCLRLQCTWRFPFARCDAAGGLITRQPPEGGEPHARTGHDPTSLAPGPGCNRRPRHARAGARGGAGHPGRPAELHRAAGGERGAASDGGRSTVLRPRLPR
jgi:hypothetical protein